MTTYGEMEATVVDEHGPGGPRPPTGRVTLVFTDIQGSTRLWERYGDSFVRILALHNDLMRDVIARERGYEVKTEGDAFMIAFDEVDDAIRFAVTAQRELHKAPWPQELLSDLESGRVPGFSAGEGFRGLRVRMGIHTGRPRCQPDPLTGRMDYFGRMVNRGARVEGIAHGGQVVLSDAAWEASTLAHESFNGLVMVDLGRHALRGLVGEEHIRQLLPEDLACRVFAPDEASSMTSVSLAEQTLSPRVRTNLPAPVASFVGREAELKDLAERFGRGSRLVSLLGPGGTGKTTLACRFGALHGAHFPGGVWFCQLEQARDLAAVCRAVASALEVELGQADLVARLAEALETRGRALVVFDNFEQVVSAASETLGVWLERCPGLTALTTTRIPVHLAGEELVVLEPLRVASPKGLKIDELSEMPAIRLFCDRAQAVRPDFVLDPSNVEDIAAIVHELDGLPLAIELAAARVRTIEPRKIRERLRRRFDILKGKRRDVTDRQATLRGAIDWSWELLQPWERAAFAQCSVFVGGFTLEAAEAVLNLDSWPEAPWPEDAVEALVDQSLLRALPPSPHGGSARYTMLSSLQVYAEEKLQQEGAIRFADGLSATGEGPMATAWDRHGQFFAEFGELDFLDSLDTSGALDRRWQLRDELANLRVAMERAVERDDPDVAVACTAAVLAVFALEGPFQEGLDLASRVLVMDRVSATEQVRLLMYRVRFAVALGKVDMATSDLNTVIGLCRQSGDRSGEGRALSALAGRAMRRSDHARAQELFDEALSILREANDREGVGNCLGNMAGLVRRKGSVDRARQLHEEALAMHRALGNRRGEGVILGQLGLLDFDVGRMEEAQQALEAALVISREVGNRRSEGEVLNDLSLLHLRAGRTQEARILLSEALELSQEVGTLREIALLRGNLGDLDLSAGRLTEAREHLEEAVRLARRVGFRVAEGVFSVSLGEEARLRGKLDAAVVLLDEGLLLLRKSGDRLELGKALCRRGRLDLDRGMRTQALSAQAEAEAIADELGAGPESELGDALAVLRIAIGSVAP